MTSTTLAAAEGLWTGLQLPHGALSRLLPSEYSDPSVDSSFRLGTAAQAAIGVSGLAAAEFHRLRTGAEQTVTVEARHAVLEFKSEAFYTLDGELPSGSLFNDLAGVYRTKDNSYVRLHTNFPHHRQGILDILKCQPTKEAVAEALLHWNAIDFETEASSRKMVATALRSFAQWDEHPQGKVLAGTPPVTITRIGDAPKRQISGPYNRPLEGIRVLELTRVLAGPVCGRTLADADVFLQSYRPGGLHDKGFGAEDVAKARPGIVYASLTAYGWESPWKDRRGFDSLVQTATGFNAAEAEAYAAYIGTPSLEPLAPKALPMQALDHAAGYLLATGISAALCKTITEGGSWEVRVSLAAVGQWIRSLGQLDPKVAFGEGRPFPPRVSPQAPEVAALAVPFVQSRADSEGGKTRRKMIAIKHAALLSRTPVRENEAPMSLHSHRPEWLGFDDVP
ncbi:CoA-transferase family III [Obba rivulosa]|uniref:CoA-transferase family III n=1 Tax=Obba rivulosa TaxID=1052685 RepID=A0A8E2AJZ8_9APHY|nr:CoA-transferase family III [Obba rivulosa]